MPHGGCCRGLRGDGNANDFEGGIISSSVGDFFIGDAPLQYAPHTHLEIVHSVIHVDVRQMAQKTAHFTVTHTVRCNHIKYRSFSLHGIDFLDLAVKDSSGFGLEYRYDGKIINIVWQDAFLSVGEERKITVTYTVENPVTGLHFSVPDDGYPNKPLYLITDNETERARYWLATVDAPVCRPTLLWTVIAPENMTVLANGNMTKEEKNDDGSKTVTHELEYGCPSYLLSLAVADFVRVSDDSVDGCKMAYYAPRGVGTEEQLMRSFGKVTPQTMVWMQKRLGVPFPFLKWRYFQVVAPCYPSAMENITQTTWNTIFLLDETWALEYKHWVDLINCHEMAHSYFGDSVTIRHFDHAWLKESWADYMESCWLEHFKGKQDFEYNLHVCSELYFEECTSYERPISTNRFNSSWQMYDNHLYPGGARRLHMLRRLLGEESFWSAVKEYLETYNWENVKKSPSKNVAASSVETDLFRLMLEKHSGHNLTQFFDQWIYGRGYPQLQGTMSFDAEKSKVTLSLVQTQEVDKTKNRYLFDMEIPIAVTDSKGNTHISSVVFSSDIESASNSATTSFTIEGTPTKVVVDPEYSLLFSLSFNPGEDILANILHDVAASVAHRIWAVKELVQLGTRNSYSVLRSLVTLPDTFYGIQIEAARAAKSTKSVFHVSILCDLLDSAVHPMAKAGVTAHCIGIRHPLLREALLRFLSKPALPYRAHARALEALGGQSNSADLELLKDHAEQAIGGWRGLVRCGAIRGLSQLCTAEAYSYLLAHVDNATEDEYSRLECTRCLGTCAFWLDSTTKAGAVSKCVQLLQDPTYAVRMAAVESLVTLKAGSPAVVSAVKAIAPSLSNQDIPWLKSKVTQLTSTPTSSEDATVVLLKKEIAALSARVAELERMQVDKRE